MKNRESYYQYADGSKFCGKTSPEVFYEIFTRADWNLTHLDSVSGKGSNAGSSTRLLNKLDVKRMLEAPYGDFHWMQQVNLPKIKYIGEDIVPE